MPVIPFSSASRVVEVDRAAQEQRDIEEARRYREKSDAKLKELMNTPVKQFDQNGGTSAIDIPEPVTGGWRVRTNDDPQRNADALPGGVFNRLGAPDINDPMRDEQGFGGPDNWTPELAMPAAPEGESFVGMGSGGPEQEVDPDIAAILEARIAKQKDRASLDLRSSLMQSTATPDQAAADLETAGKVGASRFEVEQNRKDFDIATLAKEIDKLSTDAPRSYEWLMAHTDNLEIAKDDVESLGWWEQTQAFFSPGNLSPEKVGKSLEVGFGSQLQETLWGLDRMLGESNAAIYKALPDWVPGKFGLANEQVQRSLTADMNATAWGKIKAEEMPQGVTWLERGIYGAAASSPSTVIALATTVVTKNPYIGAGLMGATTAGGAYQEAREAGKSYWESARFALTQGGIEAGTEFLPAKFLLKDLATDAPFLKTFTRNAVNEGMGEQVATFTGDLDRWLTLNPEGTIAEFFAERPNAALETLVASTIMSGVTTTVAKGMQAAGDQLDQNAKQKRAEDLAKFIDKAVDNGTNSKLLKRGTVGADKYREAVAASTDAKFRIDSDAITALAQEEGVTVEQIAQAFRIDPDEMVTAIDTGSDVLVPVGNYVAAIQTAKKEIGLDGGAIHTALGPNMRANDGDLTAREMEAREETIAQELESRKQWGEQENAFADAEDRLRDTIRQQIGSLGIYNNETVDTYVEERAARVVTLATRMSEASGQPVDVEQFYKDEFAPIEFEGDWTQGTGALPQSMARQPVPIGDVELEFASKELSPQEFEAWKGARDGLSNEQIAERMNAVEPDAVVSSDDVKRWLFRSRERGYDSQKPHYNDRGTDPKTLRLIELRARGVKNPQIAAALYPDADTQTAVNRVKALASKNKAKIEERKTALSAPESRGEFSAQTATIPRKTSLFAKQRLDTLLHEGAHEYLDLLWRLSRREDANPFVVSHLAAILNWHGLSPEWSNMYDAETGVITAEGRKLHETFAETYGVYFMTGKAPTTALRSVFETIKQWMLSVYKAAKLGLDQSIRNVGPETAARIEAHERATGKRLKGQALIDFVMPAEIREVFDRSLAVDEAINAVTARLQIDGEQMAEATLKKLDPEGKWKPERRDKFMERMRNKYIQARDLAKANFQARMIDEHMRRRTAIYEAERREVEREVQSEVDERPEQRLFAWLAGKGWRKTRGDIANEAADEAEAMRALAQAEELGYFEANATDASIQALQAKMVENGIIPIVLLFRTTSGRVIAFPGDSGNFGMHHDMAREVFGLGDLKMQHGVWNPRKWPTIEAMNAADTAWYDTTGTAADTIEAAPAQPRVMRGEAALAQGGEGLLVYRGSGDTELGAGRLGTGLYLAEDPEIGAEWGGEAGTVDAYRITGKLFDLTEETAQGLENYARRENTPAAERLFARLKAEGYVGVRDPWSGHINVFDAKDMVRTPENDSELGKTWTNYALDLEQDGAGSLAQTVQPSRQLEDAPAAFGLTPEQAKKVNPIYNPKTLPVERLPSNQDAALWLEGNYIGDPVTDLTAELSDEQIKEIATIMAAEAQLALGNTGNAFTWYSSALAKALDIISIKYPMLADDAAAAEAGFGTSRNARFAFTYIMAVTSQNLDVAANSVATDKAFADMLKRVRNGDFTMPRSWGTGDKQKAMGENFAKFGPLIDKMPGDDFPSKLEALDDLFRDKMTVKEWVAYMKEGGIPYNPPGQTAMDAVVYGSSLLGPKIGNGFWQNLNGNYDPMTIDLWMRRTWGRLTGYSIGNPAALPDQRGRLKASIARSRSRVQGDADAIASEEKRRDDLKAQLAVLKLDGFANKKAFTAEQTRLKKELSVAGEIIADLQNLKAPEAWKAEYGKDDKALLEYSKRILRAWDQEYKRLREELGDSVPADLQPTWARAAKTIVTNLAKPLDQVANGTQRKQIERAGKEALQILKARGIALTTADLQAILWYPEKELWGSLTTELETDEDGAPVVPPSSLNESYDTAFSRILKAQGYEVQGTTGDGGGGSGAGAVAGQDGESQGSQGAGGSGAPGGAPAPGGSYTGQTDGPQSLAQSQTHDPKGERELDALGFYSAVFEAAKSVRPDVWSMGWDHARNSIVKGGAKINGQRVAPRETEMAFLGLDAMFYGTKLKGAELAEAVLDHIQAKRLLLVENFARFDPNVKAPTKAAILDEIDDDTLGFMMGVAEFSMGFEEGRIVASELDGADEFHTGLFVHLNKQEVSDDPVKRYDMPRRTYNLYRGLNIPGKRELIATGVIGDLLGKAARIILNENRSLVMRKISAANMRDYWEQSRTTEDAGLTRGPGDIRLPGEDVPLFEAVIGLPEGVPGSDYRAPSSHVGGKAKGTLVTAHGEERIDDKGQRTLFTGQVQSDMAQTAREEKIAGRDELLRVKSLRVDEMHDGQLWLVNENDTVIAGPFESQADGEANLNLRIAQAEANNQKFDAPLLSTSEWTNVAVRAMVYRAAREGFQSISFPTAETSEIIQGNDSAAMHYETNVKGALEKLAKQLGGEVRRGSVDYDTDQGGEYQHYDVYGANGRKAFRYYTLGAAELAIKRGEGVEIREGSSIEPPFGPSAPAYILDITPAMRAKIMSEGFPLFQTGDDKGRATPPPNLPPMRLNLQAVKDQYGEQALAEIPPDVAAYSAEANDVEAYVQIARDVRKTLNETPPKSLWKFLSTPRNIGQGEGRISYRGIRDTDGELLKIIGEKKAARGLIADPTKDGKRSRSYDMQQAIEAAWEAGYFDGEDLPTPAQFLDTLRADIDGQAPRYRRDDIPTVSTIAGAERWKDWFDQNDMDITSDVATLRAKLATVLTGQGTSAIGPDEAAEVFNGVIGTNAFPTGFDLLKALKQGPLRDKLIRDLTEQRMIERNGDVFRDGTIMQEAEAYARNEVQHRQFEIELEALAEAAGKGTAGALAKQTAIENLRSKQVREVLNYTQWLTLERRWAEKAIKAAAKGDTAQAAEFARYRLINSHQYVEGKKLAEKIEKAVKHAKSFDGKDKRARLSKAGPDYIQQIDQILEGYEFKPVTRKKEAERTSLREWFAAKQATLDPMRDLSGLSEEELMAAQLEEIERSDALAAMQADASVQNYKSLTVEELMAVSDQLDMIERMARKEGALLVDGERRLLSLALDDIEAQAIAATPKELPPESFASFAPKEKNKRGFKEFFVELRTMQSIVRFIDGIDGGPLAKNTIHKLNTAIANGTARLRLEEDRVVALFRAAYGINVDDLRKDQVRIPGIPVPLAKMERLTVALYMGTEISRKRLRDGYGWDDATLQSVINTLDQKDWAFVTSVWKYVNSLYPEAAKAHEEVHHVPLTKQPGLPIVTRFGVIQGDYFPISYNPHQSSRADQQALTETAKQITGRAGTRKATSSTKARVQGKVTMPVLLDFSITLGKHVNEVVGNITTQKAILDAGRIIAHPRTEKLIVSRHGRVTYNALMSAMKDTRNGLAAPNGPTQRIASRVRNGATNVALGLNIGTVVKQVLGYTTSIVRLGDNRLGPIAGAGWLIRGMVRMGFSASGMQNGTAFILQRSSYMGVRMQVMNQAIADQQRRINDGNIKADIKRGIDIASFWMMQRLQFLAVDSPTWLGAYEKFTASGMSDEDASASADQVVIDAQGSGEIFQVSAFQRGGPIQRIFTNYLTAAIANWNLAVNVTRGANFRNPGQAAIWAMNMGVLMTVPVIGSMAINAMMSPGGEDDDEPLEEEFIRSQIAFLISPLGLAGQMGGAVSGFGYNGPQGTRFFEEASKVITETFTGAERVLAGTATPKDAIDVLRPANMAAGVWFGYPAAALDRFVRGAEALASGKTEDPKALLSGPPRE